jgi:hypothetical protein
MGEGQGALRTAGHVPGGLHFRVRLLLALQGAERA